MTYYTTSALTTAELIRKVRSSSLSSQAERDLADRLEAATELMEKHGLLSTGFVVPEEQGALL